MKLKCRECGNTVAFYREIVLINLYNNKGERIGEGDDRSVGKLQCMGCYGENIEEVDGDDEESEQLINLRRLSYEVMKMAHSLDEEEDKEEYEKTMESYFYYESCINIMEQEEQEMKAKEHD